MSTLEITVFGLRMMLKSGLFFILISYKNLQTYCCPLFKKNFSSVYILLSERLKVYVHTKINTNFWL